MVTEKGTQATLISPRFLSFFFALSPRPKMPLDIDLAQRDKCISISISILRSSDTIFIRNKNTVSRCRIARIQRLLIAINRNPFPNYHSIMNNIRFMI